MYSGQDNLLTGIFEMPLDVLLLNTAVTDLRRPEFEFCDTLVGKGGLAKCKTKDMPDYSQEQIQQWIEQGCATAGGPGNCAPLIARAGLGVAVGVLLGKGNYKTNDSKFELDAQGKFFYDTMIGNKVDMSPTVIHPHSQTGTTFIHVTPRDKGERGGIVYFPNANNDFDFEVFKKHVERLQPKIVYYMYSGLSDKGDSNDGKDLANFIRWCREKGAVTIVDTHTLTGMIQEGIEREVAGYMLLKPLLPELDIFFCSLDEARMIAKSVDYWKPLSRSEIADPNRFPTRFLNSLRYKSNLKEGRARLFGMTYSRGAFYVVIHADGTFTHAKKVESKYLGGETIDLVGAGDAFRGGLLAAISRNLERFKGGSLGIEEAVQMGNLFASLYIKSPLNERYTDIQPYQNMLKVVRSRDNYASIEQLRTAVNQP